ncbi:MAG: PilN domain-containing protein [Planctomycetota bacterium]
MNNIFSQNDAGGQSFLPGDYVQAKADTKTNLLGVVAFTFVMFGVVAMFVISNRRWESVRSDQEQVAQDYELALARITQLQELEATRKEMLGKAQVATALIETLPRSVLLGELVLRMPEGLSLDELTIESKRVKTEATPASAKGKRGSLQNKGAKPAEEPETPKAPKFTYSLSIVGLAAENNMVADYLAALKGCPLLDDVEIEYIRTTKVGDWSYRRFRILAVPNQDADITELASIQQAMLEPGDAGAEGEDAGVGGGLFDMAWGLFAGTRDGDEQDEEAGSIANVPEDGEE